MSMANRLQNAIVWCVLLAVAAQPLGATIESELAATILAATIDRLVGQKLASHGIDPAPRSDDFEICRRLYLDLAGRIPTRDELLAFVNSADSEKRVALVQRLASSEDFVIHWANNIHTLLRGERGRLPMGDDAWANYLRNSIREGHGWDRMAAEMILARPLKGDDDGADRFLVHSVTSGTVARDVSRAFFGVDIQCAMCHRHIEVEEWTPKSYWGMAAFFNRSYIIKAGNRLFVGERATGEVSFKEVGQQEDQLAAPVFLTGEKPPEEPEPVTEDPERTKQRVALLSNVKAGDPLLDNPDHYLAAPEVEPTGPTVPRYSRRQQLAKLAVNDQNPYFVHSLVNRVWKRMMGQGLVEPLDQLHVGNPPTHPELLDALAEDFVRHGHDLRHLATAIAHSETYQRTSNWSGERPDQQLYAVGMVKPLILHQYVTALFCAAGYFRACDGRAVFEENSSQAIATLHGALDTGSAELDVSAEGSLYLANSPEFDEWIAKGDLVTHLMNTSAVDEVVSMAFERVLSRPPDSDELSAIGKYLAAKSDRKEQAWKQVIWSLLNSAEFRFNH